jgi:hypothetical protein
MHDMTPPGIEYLTKPVPNESIVWLCLSLAAKTSLQIQGAAMKPNNNQDVDTISFSLFV